jgi:hypothetical protein
LTDRNQPPVRGRGPISFAEHPELGPTRVAIPTPIIPSPRGQCAPRHSPPAVVVVSSRVPQSQISASGSRNLGAS